MEIPKTREAQIALRDKLTALIDHPGADPTPIEGTDYSGNNARNSRVAPSLHRSGAVFLGIGNTGAHMAPDDARRLAARLVFVADNLYSI